MEHDVLTNADPAVFSSRQSAPRSVELDERAPEAVVTPVDEREAILAVRSAVESRTALVPCGGATALQQGNLLRSSRWTAVSTDRLTNLVEFSPADMVVTAQAGASLAALQSALAREGQFLPIDAPEPEIATLGGIVATNWQGLWRPAYGAPRDRLLGLRVVLADGSVVRAGGKVVKNVAGYDLCKLFAGSWGTLGLICEATFKTNPLPPARAHVVFRAGSARAALSAALEVHTRQLQPLYLCVLTRREVSLCVGLMGAEETIAWQEREISGVLEACGLRREDEGPTETELREFATHADGSVQARVTTAPSQLPDLAGRLPSSADALFHVPTGIVEISLARQADTGNVRSEVGAIRDVVPAFGRLVWTRIPVQWKAEMDVWGPTRGDFGLMRSLKETLDPRGLFSPGRFVGGL